MRNVVAVLEDDKRRRDAMRSCLSDRFPPIKHIFIDHAGDMIEWLRHEIDSVCLISLDHDLDTPTDSDPGTGRDVADYLASLKPVCPVIIHTTNRFGGDGMRFALLDAGWSVTRVVPIGDLSWVKDGWAPKAADVLKSLEWHNDR